MRGKRVDWTSEMDTLLGTMFDWQVGERLGIHDVTVGDHRRELGIAPFRFPDLTGQRFAKWLVLKRTEHFGKGTHWLCQCDCGVEKTIRGDALKDGTSRSCRSCAAIRGENHPWWNGGRAKHGGGYILILMHEHPNTNARGYIPEHRFIMEQKLGRYLTRMETVHHKNGIKNDNRIENLELWIGNHGHSSRVSDQLTYATKILAKYAPERLALEWRSMAQLGDRFTDMKDEK